MKKSLRPAILTLAGLLAALVLLALSSAPALASPVLPQPITLTQPDGVTFEARPFGDEWNNGLETFDGFTILQDEASGEWRYAVPDAAGVLTAGPARAEGSAPAGVSPHLRAPTLYAADQPLGPDLAFPHAGSEPQLVLLARFSDRGPVGSTAADWAARFFAAAGSVKDYYEEVSYGQLHITPANETHGTANDGVVGWLNLGYPHPDTRGNTDSRNQSIVRNAILAANPYVNFGAYDTNHDGFISRSELHITVIVAGYETSYGGSSAACSPSVWGHSWTLGQGSVAAPVVDGVSVAHYSVGGYTQVGEWHCASWDTPGHMATIGILVHELGHDIEWPDLYDTDGSSEGVGNWSVMGSGSWNNAEGEQYGAQPAHPDAFLKWYQAWLTPTRVASTQAGVVLAQAATNPRAVQVLANPGGVDWHFQQHSGAGQYFLIENRRRVGYDAGLPGCGLLIWHIDETRTSTNQANATDTRRLVDLEEADGRNDLDVKANRGDAGDPYPGSADNRLFGPTSNPNNRLYDGSAGGFSVAIQSASCAANMTADIFIDGSAYVQRVNAGGPAYTDTAGRLWAADRMFSAGSWGATGGSIVTTTNPIANTEDDALYQTDRNWAGSASPGYRFTVPNGAYEVTLKFAEVLMSAADQRKFTVRMEGIQVLTRYDIYSVAGAPNKAVADRVFVINVADGVLNIDFIKVIDGPKINAIQVKQLTSYELGVNVGGGLYTDSAGKTWRSDKNYGPGSWGYTGGSVKTTTAAIANTTDDTLYQSERQWSSTAAPGYRFAVPNGTYQVTFKFAETAYAAAGKRVFNVKLEGVTKLSNYDIFAAAGGKNIAAPDRTFTVQVTDGELTVDFIQVVGAPKVNAIRLKRTGD